MTYPISVWDGSGEEGEILSFPSLAQAEEAFLGAYLEGVKAAARAWLILYAIRRSGAWRERAATFSEYLLSLQERLSAYIPCSLSQMWSALRTCLRAEALGLTPGEAATLLSHPTVANRLWALAQWDRKSGEPLALRAPEVGEALKGFYGTPDATTALGELARDVAAAPTVSEAHRILSERAGLASSALSFHLTVAEDGHVVDLKATVEQYGPEGYVAAMEEVDLLHGPVPEEVVRTLARRLGCSPMTQGREEF